MSGPGVILDRQRVVVECRLLECRRDGVPQRVADQSNERGHGDGKYIKRRGRAPTGGHVGAADRFLQVTEDGGAARTAALSSNRAEHLGPCGNLRHLGTFSFGTVLVSVP